MKKKISYSMVTLLLALFAFSANVQAQAPLSLTPPSQGAITLSNDVYQLGADHYVIQFSKMTKSLEKDLISLESSPAIAKLEIDWKTNEVNVEQSAMTKTQMLSFFREELGLSTSTQFGN